MEIGTKTFAEFVLDVQDKKRFGMVITGAGEPYEEWLDGINKLLYEENILTLTPCFDLAYVLSDNVKGKDGRTDLIMFFSNDANPNVGKLAIWRLKFGSCMWTEDFVDNHHNEFKSGYREYITDNYVEEEA